MEKSKSKWVWLILGIVVVISLLGIGYYVYDKLDSNLKDKEEEKENNKEEDNSWVSEGDDNPVNATWNVIEDNTIFNRKENYLILDLNGTYLKKFNWNTYVSPKELTTSLVPGSDGFERVMADGTKVRFKATNETYYNNGLTEKLEYDVIFEGMVFKDTLSYSATTEGDYISKDFYYYNGCIIDYNHSYNLHELKVYNTYDIEEKVNSSNVIMATIKNEGNGFQTRLKLYYIIMSDTSVDEMYDQIYMDEVEYQYYYYDLDLNENVHIKDFKGAFSGRIYSER